MEENWDQKLGFLMHDVSRLRRIVFDALMKPTGVTRSQWWVLAYLSRHDGMTQSDLASILELGKAALGGIIDRLESSGLVMRNPDPIDRRIKRIHLISSGKLRIKEMQSLSHDLSEEILEGLDEKERLHLAQMLNVVKKNLLSIKKENGASSS